MKFNCLQYALRFWDEHPEYRIFYNGDHVINMLHQADSFIPIEDYGYNHILNSFKDTMKKKDLRLLRRYFMDSSLNHQNK